MRALPLALMLLLSACAYGPQIQTDFDPAANFAAYRTYQWVQPEVPRGMNPIMFRRVQASIDRSLAARGYAPAQPADFAISFTIGERDRTEVSTYPTYYSGWSHGWGWGGWGWGTGWGWGGGWGGWWPYYPAVDVYEVTERSIVVDIYDSRSRAAVWHGSATTDAYSDKVDYAKLDKSIDALLAAFPPQPPAQPAMAAADTR